MDFRFLIRYSSLPIGKKEKLSTKRLNISMEIFHILSLPESLSFKLVRFLVIKEKRKIRTAFSHIVFLQ